MKRAQLHPLAGGQRGLTLMELLVTMVIFSLVISVFAQALFQINLVQARATRSTEQWPDTWQQGFAIDDSFKTQRAQQRPQDLPASGTVLRFESHTVQDSGELAGRAVRSLWRLAPTGSSTADGTPWWALTVQLEEDADTPLSAAQRSVQVLARWPGPVAFRYSSHTNLLSQVWPPHATRQGEKFLEVTPSAIHIVRPDGALAHVWTYRGRTQARDHREFSPFGEIVR